MLVRPDRTHHSPPYSRLKGMIRPSQHSASLRRDDEHRGAYGITIHGLEQAAWAMVPQPIRATRIHIEIEAHTNPPNRPSSLTGTDADLGLVGGGRLRMHRGESTWRFTFPTAAVAADVLHPFLAPAAALTQLWAGHDALHAGAFETPSGAVLLLGGKADGKSTTLAWIATERNLPVLSDDLAVIADSTVLAGPRFIDLRKPIGAPAASLARGGTRQRLALEPCSPTRPIAGIVILGWGASVALRPTESGSRLGKLAAQRMFGTRLETDPRRLLDLAALPMLTFTRPQQLDALPAVDAILDYFS